MTKLAETVHAFRLRRSSTTKATDHELQEYDNFTRYGQVSKTTGATQNRARKTPQKALQTRAVVAPNGTHMTPRRTRSCDAVAGMAGSAAK